MGQPNQTGRMPASTTAGNDRPRLLQRVQRQPETAHVKGAVRAPVGVLNRTARDILNRQPSTIFGRKFATLASVNECLPRQRPFTATRRGRDFTHIPVYDAGHPFLQTKSRVGPASDVYEREADRVAAQVVTVPATGRSHTVETAQRREEDAIHMKPPAATITPAVQRQAFDEEEEELQLRPAAQRMAGAGGGPVTPGVEEMIGSARGNGRGLAGDVRAPMEHAFGADFSGVQVHADERSDALSRSLNARAFTTGQDIFFKQGEYRPGSSNGRQLLADELTHVVQQRGNQIVNRTSDDGGVAQARPMHQTLDRIQRDPSDRMAKLIAFYEQFQGAGNRPVTTTAIDGDNPESPPQLPSKEKRASAQEYAKLYGPQAGKMPSAGSTGSTPSVEPAKTPKMSAEWKEVIEGRRAVDTFLKHNKVPGNIVKEYQALVKATDSPDFQSKKEISTGTYGKVRLGTIDKDKYAKKEFKKEGSFKEAIQATYIPLIAKALGFTHMPLGSVGAVERGNTWYNTFMSEQVGIATAQQAMASGGGRKALLKAAEGTVHDAMLFDLLFQYQDGWASQYMVDKTGNLWKIDNDDYALAAQHKNRGAYSSSFMAGLPQASLQLSAQTRARILDDDLPTKLQTLLDSAYFRQDSKERVFSADAVKRALRNLADLRALVEAAEEVSPNESAKGLTARELFDYYNRRKGTSLAAELDLSQDIKGEYEQDILGEIGSKDVSPSQLYNVFGSVPSIAVSNVAFTRVTGKGHTLLGEKEQKDPQFHQFSQKRGNLDMVKFAELVAEKSTRYYKKWGPRP